MKKNKAPSFTSAPSTRGLDKSSTALKSKVGIKAKPSMTKKEEPSKAPLEPEG